MNQKMKKNLVFVTLLVAIVGTIAILEIAGSGISGKDTKLTSDEFGQRVTPYEFKDIEQWLNSEELTLDGLNGKVVMVDFWTLGCINCQNTFPHVTAWHDEYSEKGLVIVGVHSPEFKYERELANVKASMAEHGLEYPIAIDNDFATWRNFENRWWPHLYLFDKDGVLRYDHIGEGGYAETERWIEKLLNE